jgi:hypothetical protein
LRRRGGKSSIPLHTTFAADGAPPQGDARQGFITLPVIRDGFLDRSFFVRRHAQ